MNLESLSNIYQLLNEDGIIISYQGVFHQEIIEEITSIINLKLSSDPGTKNKHKYLTMFVELSQNILRYSSDSLLNSEGKQISTGIILVGTKDDKIFVISGNPISPEYRDDIDEKLKTLTTLSVEDLNMVYKQQLKTKDRHNFNKSAGLGLVDIIRKADKSEYNIHDQSPGKPFLTIKVEYKL
ncbi:MAG: SiaB family protein kinase [Spirochaetaceae bacterium]